MATSTSSAASSASSASLSPTSGINSQNFATGLFTDFAPLLTLFGDEVTKQFLATSMGWGDNILLGLAPIGIVTVIVSAIRIGGFQLMKTFIGRARDSPDDEEKDILSSTSRNVREIWDGNRVIRQSGESQTTELVYTVQKRGHPAVQGTREGLRTLKDAFRRKNAINQRVMPLYRWKQSVASKISQSDEENLETSKEGVKLAAMLDGKAPSLTLNIPKAIPSKSTVWFFTAVGLVVQFVVYVFNGLAVYRWHWLRQGSVVASYGYPVWAIGTFSITLGVCLCALVVEVSTTEYIAEPNFEQKATIQLESGRDATKAQGPENPSQALEDLFSFRVLRLQKAISTANLPTFAIFNEAKDPRVRISHRTVPPPTRVRARAIFGTLFKRTLPNVKPDSGAASDRQGIVTVLGTLLAIAGFICQNIGTRELHWSGGISQLLATLILALLRALVRQHVGESPSIVLKLRKGFEASHLTYVLHDVRYWKIHTGSMSAWKSEEESSKKDSYQSAALPVEIPPAFFKPPDTQPLAIQGQTEADLSHQARDTVDRMLSSVKLLLDLEPGRVEIKNMATKLHHTIEAMLDEFSVPDFRWDQKILLQEIAPSVSLGGSEGQEELFAPRLTFLKVWETGTRDLSISPGGKTKMGQMKHIEAILSLAMYSFTRAMEQGSPIDRFGIQTWHIVGSCATDGELAQKALLISRMIGYTERFVRARNSKVSGPIRDNYSKFLDSNISDTVFGLPYSAMKYNDHGQVLSPERSMTEFFSLSNGSSFLESLALDFFSAFMLALLSQDPDEQVSIRLAASTTARARSEISVTGGYNRKDWENDLFETLIQILLTTGLTHSRNEAKRAIIPAFIAQDKLLPKLIKKAEGL